MPLFKKRINAFIPHNASDERYAEQLGDPEERKRKSGFSYAYHKYFKGYAEREYIDEKGKKRIERIYVSNTYRHSMTDKKWVLLKLLYAFMFVFGAAAYITITAQSIAASFTWYVQMLVAIGAFSLFILLYTLVNYITAKRNLTVHDYEESSSDLKLRGVISAAACFLPAIGFIGYAIADKSTSGLVTAAELLIPSAVFAAMAYIEAKMVKYDIIPYEGDIPGDFTVLV